MIRSFTRLVLVFVLVAGVAACASHHTDSLACHSTTVAANAQPFARTPDAALHWFLAHMAKAQRVPTSGFRLEGHTATRAVYVAKGGRTRVAVANLGTAPAPRWAVETVISC